MRRQLFAAGVAVALLLGAASPAIAKPDNGKHKGQVNKPAKKPHPPKGPKANNKSGVSGGGAVLLGTFSAQAKLKHQAKGQGHFNYTSNDGSFKLRCRGFQPFVADKAGTTVTFTNCATTTGAEPTQVRTAIDPVAVVFIDKGQPSAVAKDNVTFTVGGVSYGGDLTDGNIKIR